MRAIAVITLDFQSINLPEILYDHRAALGGADFLTKPRKVLYLITSGIATVSLKEIFRVRVLLKRERKPLFH